MKSNIARALVACGAVVVIGAGSAEPAWAQDNNNQGLTRGFYASPQGGGGWGSVVLDEQFRDIQRLSLPPGRYIASASAALASGSSPDFHPVACFFRVADIIVSDSVQAMIGGSSSNNFVTLPLTFGFTITTAQDLAVACATERPDLGIVSQPSPITAIRVDRLTVQGGFQP